MCGIAAVYGENHREAIKTISATLGNRGKDNFSIVSTDEYSIAHSLHSVVGFVHQPLEDCFAANCEVYNYQDLAKEFDLDCENDAQACLLLMKKIGVEKALPLLDGDFAFVYVHEGTLYFACDPVGVKPLFFEEEEGRMYVASEAKMLSKPRRAKPGVLYTFKKGKRTETAYHEYTLSETSIDMEEATKEVQDFFTAAVKKRKVKRAAVLFSGGLDSSYLALELQRAGCDVHLYTVAYSDGNLADSRDLIASRELAKELNLPLTEVLLDNNAIEELLPTVMHIMEDENPVKVGVGIATYAVAKQASADGHRVIYSGLGAEELYAGYRRHLEAEYVNEECLEGLRKAHESDLYRDELLCIHGGVELRAPFFDNDLINHALSLPGYVKIVDNMRKFVLRQAAFNAGLPEEAAFRPKLACQYGSNIQKGFERLSRSYPSIREYFASLR